MSMLKFLCTGKKNCKLIGQIFTEPTLKLIKLGLRVIGQKADGYYSLHQWGFGIPLVTEKVLLFL